MPVATSEVSMLAGLDDFLARVDLCVIAVYQTLMAYFGVNDERLDPSIRYLLSRQMAAASELWRDTAIFVIFDEGGGYYDSGYVQPLDFFGDGTRIPLLVVSSFSRGVPRPSCATQLSGPLRRNSERDYGVSCI